MWESPHMMFYGHEGWLLPSASWRFCMASISWLNEILKLIQNGNGHATSLRTSASCRSHRLLKVLVLLTNYNEISRYLKIPCMGTRLSIILNLSEINSFGSCNNYFMKLTYLFEILDRNHELRVYNCRTIKIIRVRIQIIINNN